MAATLERHTASALPPRGEFAGDARRSSTLVVVDESGDTDIETLRRALEGVGGAVTILVTRHAPPPCVIGVGSGMEAAVMWNECMSEHQAVVRATDERVRRLAAELMQSGTDSVERVDCHPTSAIFRRRRRREVDAVVRAVRVIAPDRIVIDAGHHRGLDLLAALPLPNAGLTEATASR